MGGASQAAARQGRPLLPQASNPCSAHPMASGHRSSILDTEMPVGARWASERIRRRRRSHASVEAPETLDMVRA